jgi:hypothetical protein
MMLTPIGKRRNAGVVILLTFVTLGIYLLVWYYKINSEIKEHDPNQDFSPGLATLAIIIPIANLVSYYNTANRIKMMQKADGSNDLISPGAALLWALLFFIGYPIYIQSALNNHWHEHRNDVMGVSNKPLMEPPLQGVQANQQVNVLIGKGANLGGSDSTPKIAESAINYDLHALSGPLAGTSVDLSPDPIIMGRDPRVSNLIIPLGNISRKHCTLKFVNGNVIMEDNGSVNGTFLSDGQRLASGIPYKLKPGDRFFLADRAILFEIRHSKPH